MVETFPRASEVIGEFLVYTQPDPVGEILGTGYNRFRSICGIHGLAKEEGHRIDILAVDAERESTGQFREFIARLKDSFETICIWEVWNKALAMTLVRYDFAHTTQVEDDGEVLSGFIWTR
jgi:hypothetical protein